MPERFSYRLEREYYEQPRAAAGCSYARLEAYLSSWLDPVAVFGGKRVLEIGAGEALYSRMIADRFAPGWVVALDLVPAQLMACRRETKNARVLCVGGDCFHLPLHEKNFDVIFGSLLLHRFRELANVLKEIYRALVSGGVYVGIEPCLSNPLHLFRRFFSDHSRNEFLLARRRIRRAFAETGFRVRIIRLAPRFPHLRRVGLATCVGIWASKEV